jgi:hypothetical protein
MGTTDSRLMRLRAQIAAGTYTPPADAVAESLVGWIATPEQFDRPRPADRGRVGSAADEERGARG